MSDYLTKPLKLEHLRATLRRIAERNALDRVAAQRNALDGLTNEG